MYVYSGNKATVEWLNDSTFLHKIKDLRIQRLHSWIAWHFNKNTIQFCFIDGNRNIIADTLSRWKLEHPVKTEIPHKLHGYKNTVNAIMKSPTYEKRDMDTASTCCSLWAEKDTAESSSIGSFVGRWLERRHPIFQDMPILSTVSTKDNGGWFRYVRRSMRKSYHIYGHYLTITIREVRTPIHLYHHRFLEKWRYSFT